VVLAVAVIAPGGIVPLDAEAPGGHPKLESSSLSVTEIAFQCGFKDGNYFSRQFRQIMGASPLQYREIFRGSRPAP
jgi:hypothetical protein